LCVSAMNLKTNRVIDGKYIFFFQLFSSQNINQCSTLMCVSCVVRALLNAKIFSNCEERASRGIMRRVLRLRSWNRLVSVRLSCAHVRVTSASVRGSVDIMPGLRMCSFWGLDSRGCVCRRVIRVATLIWHTFRLI
jgi:hypothetical protein